MGAEVGWSLWIAQLLLGRKNRLEAEEVRGRDTVTSHGEWKLRRGRESK